jgi:polysaccharide biosynthesis protein PslH
MDYFPNIDGILYFVKSIFPILRKHIPDVELQIVGSNPVQAIRDLATTAGVTVTGHVSDVRPYLSSASVAIAPLRIARGTQNKILEAMAVGIPVVATSQAAKGVQATPGEHLLVADDPESFAHEMIRMLDNVLLRNRISAAARRQIEAAHSWDASMRILDGMLQNFGSSAGAQAPAGALHRR